MAASTRIVRMFLRLLAVVVAAGFLVLYVWQAQGRRAAPGEVPDAAFFSSSKNLRTVFPGEPGAANHGQFYLSPDGGSFSATAVQGGEGGIDLFRFGVQAPDPVVFGDSRSVGSPPAPRFAPPEASPGERPLAPASAPTPGDEVPVPGTVP